MSKSSLVSAVVGSFLLLLLPACDTGGNGTLISCATSLVGSFEGDRQGPMIGQVQLDPQNFESGELVTIIDPDDADRYFRGTSTLEPDGTIKGGGLLVVNGTIDLYDCSASGDWTLGMASGTWSMGLR